MLLNIPLHVEVIAMLTVGYPANNEKEIQECMSAFVIALEAAVCK